MPRCRVKESALTLPWCEARQAEQLCLDPIIDGERAELIDALCQSTNVANEILYQGLSYVRLIEKKLSERSTRYRCNRAAVPSLHTGTARFTIYGGILAENVAWTQIAKADRLACNRIDRDPNLTGRHEEHFVRGIEIIYDWVPWSVSSPRTVFMDSFQNL
jgi:hypothetical protein